MSNNLSNDGWFLVESLDWILIGGNWNGLRAGKKCEALQGIENRMAEKQKRDPYTVIEAELSFNVGASVNHSQKTIKFNYIGLNMQQSLSQRIDMVRMIIHEGRHVQQKGITSGELPPDNTYKANEWESVKKSW